MNSASPPHLDGPIDPEALPLSTDYTVLYENQLDPFFDAYIEALLDQVETQTGDVLDYDKVLFTQNDAHSDVLRELLSALSNTDVSGTYTDANGQESSIQLSEIVGTLFDQNIAISSSSDLGTNTLGLTTVDPVTGAVISVQINSDTLGLLNILTTIIHESIHVWAQTNGIDHGTPTQHPDWIEPLAILLANAVVQANPSSFSHNPGAGHCAN